jgi:hypothetical protein
LGHSPPLIPRESAAYPAEWTKDGKFWPAVGRVDNAYGDRNLGVFVPYVEDMKITISFQSQSRYLSCISFNIVSNWLLSSNILKPSVSINRTGISIKLLIHLYRTRLRYVNILDQWIFHNLGSAFNTRK